MTTNPLALVGLHNTHMKQRFPEKICPLWATLLSLTTGGLSQVDYKGMVFMIHPPFTQITQAHFNQQLLWCMLAAKLWSACNMTALPYAYMGTKGLHPAYLFSQKIKAPLLSYGHCCYSISLETLLSTIWESSLQHSYLLAVIPCSWCNNNFQPCCFLHL